MSGEINKEWLEKQLRGEDKKRLSEKEKFEENLEKGLANTLASFHSKGFDSSEICYLNEDGDEVDGPYFWDTHPDGPSYGYAAQMKAEFVGRPFRIKINFTTEGQMSGRFNADAKLISPDDSYRPLNYAGGSIVRGLAEGDTAFAAGVLKAVASVLGA